MPNRLAHFEIHATNLEVLVKFYTQVFGWEIKKWEGGQFEYWMVMTGADNEAGGINGGLILRKGDAPAQGAPVNGFVCTMVVDSYDAIAQKIIENGGKEVVPKFALANMAWQGYFLDPDNNIFGLHQADPNAK